MLKVLDIFFSTVKPAIPICLYTTLLFSMKRLENAKIHTINRFKINEAGRIDMVCFDKTGTLTEEFPKTFAYGINYVPYNVKFSKPFEKLICPPIMKMKKKKNLLKGQDLSYKSDMRLKPKKMMESKNRSDIKKIPKRNDKGEIMRRFTNKLSSIGDIYKIDNRDRNSSLNVNTMNTLSFVRRNTQKFMFLDYSGPKKNIEYKGQIKDFCDNVDQIIQDIKYNRMAKKYLECMSFCHTLINIDNTYIGDPLEVEMASKSPFICRYVSNRNSSKFKKIYFPKSKKSK
jgi:magnesium-transporting ATPase (P-type)